MLPDFPAFKKRAREQLLRAVERRVPELEPILGEIRHTRIHEGRAAHMTRADTSTQDINFQRAAADLTIPREQMRDATVEQLLEIVTHLAKQIAEQQARYLFATIERSITESGNVVSAAALGEKEAFLEIERRVQCEFDPETLEPTGMMLVLHPTQVERLKVLAPLWEADPEFVAERARIRAKKLAEWRARESSRKLVD